MLRTTLDDTQRRELRQMTRQAVGRVSERARYVLMSAQGRSVPEIARLMECHAASVRHWLKAYQQEGSARLYDAPRSGRPPRSAASSQGEAAHGDRTGSGQPVAALLRLCASLLDRGLVVDPSVAAFPPPGECDHAAPGAASGGVLLDATQAGLARECTILCVNEET